MQKIAKNAVAAVLGWQVKRLRRKNAIKIIAITGSIGKTSTKLAIARVLSRKYSVQYQEGNYNDLVSVPLVFFGQTLPNIYNPLAWMRIFIKNEDIIKRRYPYQVVVVELGTDAPGQIQQFSRYVHADVAVITAITPEHMEYFADLDAVAREEMAIGNFSHKVFANSDLIRPDYLSQLAGRLVTYGINSEAEVKMANIKFDQQSASFEISHGPMILARAEHERVTEPQLYSICAAAAVAEDLGVGSGDIEKGIRSIKPVSGRMRHLDGIKGSVIIDDTYNASPEATKAALDTLYRIKAPAKIAILGNMNELGAYSAAEHKKIGEYCDPKRLNLVITIGPDANKYLAPAALAKGCKVKAFDNPVEAGLYIKTALVPGAAILAKGSQNKVFAEEAVKQLLADPADSEKLVRQSPQWLKVKQKSFQGKNK